MLKKINSSHHFQSFIEHAGTSGFAVISFMILARVLTKEDFGQWTLYLTLLTFIDMIKFGVVKTALIKYASGLDLKSKHELIGSSWFLNLLFVLITFVLFYFVLFLNFFEAKGISFFLIFYPIYSFISLPFYNFLWNHQVLLSFKKITLIKLFNSFLFLTVCGLTTYFEFTLKQIIILHSVGFSLSSILALFIGNTGIKQLFNTTKFALKLILDFAKFHTMAFLGSNLLKSADIFLIGAFLGSTAVAIYSIPLRLIELIEAPLRAVVSVAFPVLSAHDNNKNALKLKNTLEKYIGIMTILYIPFMGILYMLAEPLVLLIGGEKYIDSVIIFHLFIIYGLFLPFDRLTGIALDAIGLPKLNFYKVMVMATINIIGDFIAIYFFKSIELVALITVANVLSGTVIGYIFLKSRIELSLKSIIKNGFATILNYLKKNHLSNQLN